ncbi:MAG: thiamine phosphate synthase [Bacteroidales bacterium]|nr:thiamine phosphate synthase [Bacteroidales bacterium]
MIQFIMHHNERFSYLDSARLALEGGCKWIQLRMKEASDAEIVACGKEVSALCKKYGATFIIDDHVELVREIGADGVHLGKNDMPINEARKIMGEKFIIGGTANTYADVENHYRNGANYIGCGPFRFTTTKKNLSPILGLDGYSDVVSQMKKNGIDIPIVAIGGITEADIPAVMATGVTGIALSGEVLNAADPVAKMKTILKLLK